jgi:hypothetical protein
MKILIDENKYLTCVCIDAELNGGIEVETPEDVDAFIDAFRAYKYENGNLILDNDKLEILNGERIVDMLRHKREKVCFPYINRGEMWYNRLSAEQKDELAVWYQAWLDVTNTKVVPQTPEWLI